MDGEKKKHKIGNVTAGFMVLLALVADGLQFLLTLSVLLLPLSLLVTFLCAVGFVLWFFILGAYTGKGAEKKALTSGVSMVAEFIPVINAIPAITAGVVINIILTRLDDAHISLAKPDPKKMVSAARTVRMQAARAQLRERTRERRQQNQEDRHAPVNTGTAAPNRVPANDNQQVPAYMRPANDNGGQNTARKAA